jgi:hypothetical protein
MHARFVRRFQLLCGAAAMLALPGCDSILSLDGNPKACAQPQLTESVTDELAVVRVIQSPGASEYLVLDRVRYLAPADQRYRNRVIYGTTEKLRPAGEGLPGVQQGDTVKISTVYTSQVQGGGYEAFIPNWVINEWDCFDGAMVSVHSLNAIEVVGR